MLFPKTILLLFIFGFDPLQATKTASLIIDESAEVKLENLLVEFFADAKESGFGNLDDSRLIVLGRRENFLQTTKALLKNGAFYSIGTKAEADVFPSRFSADSVVLFFVDGFSDSEIAWIFSKLPNNYKLKALIILIEDRPEDFWTTMLKSVSKIELRNVSYVRFLGPVVKVYGHRPKANCVLERRLISTWISKKGFRKQKTVDQKSTSDEHGCPRFVSTFQILPTMKLRQEEDKSWRIIGGVEGRLIKSIAKYLNIVLVVKIPSMEEKFLIADNGTVLGIVGDVARGEATFGIGQIRPTSSRAKIVDLTTPYNHECMVWTVPLKIKHNFSVVISEFSTATWIAVILTASMFYGLIYVIRKLDIGYSSSLTIFDVIAMTLSYAIPRSPSGLLCRLFFLLYLHYSRVLSTAYSASLSSILTMPRLEPEIVELKEILATDLRIAGSQTSRKMLTHLISPGDDFFELMNRYEVISSAAEALQRLSNRRDIVYLRHRSTIEYAANKLLMAGKKVPFYSLPNCVISFNTVMVTPKGSRLTGLVNDVILRLREAGIYSHWTNLDHISRFEPRKFHSNIINSMFKLESVFVMYLCCLIPAFLAFFTEFIVFKQKLNWFTR